jgi:ATP phosphoribosyltransferase regulatory subunit HisZ
VHGAPEAILQGGRYDKLLQGYGRDLPAVGFAIDVEATAGALEQLPAAALTAPPPHANGEGGVLIAGPHDQAFEAAVSVRKLGRRAAVVDGQLAGDALEAYARRWLFSEVRRLGGTPAGARPSKSRRK